MVSLLSRIDFMKWRNLLNDARENQRSRRIQWAKNVRWLKNAGELVSLSDIDWDESSPNLLRRFVQTRLNSYYMSGPEIDVVPEDIDLLHDAQGMDMGTVGATQAAQMLEKVVNDMYRRTRQAREDMDSIVDAICFGIGVKVHGYHTDTLYDPDTDLAQYAFGFTEPAEPDDHRHAYRVNKKGNGITTQDGKDKHTHKIAGMYVMPAGKGKKEHTHDIQAPFPKDDIDDRMLVLGMFRKMNLIGYDDPDFTYSDRISSEQPWGQSVKPWMFVMDIDARRLTDARWAGYAQYKTIRELKRDVRWQNTEHLSAKDVDVVEAETPELLHYTRLGGRNSGGTTEMGGAAESALFGTEDDEDNQRVLLWTIFIKSDPILDGPDHNNKVLCMVEGHDEPLYYKDNPYKDVTGIPYIPITTLSWNEPVVGQWPPDDIEDWLSLVHEYLSVRAAINRQTKTEGQNKMLIDSTEFGQDVAGIIDSAPANSIIPIQGLNKAIQEGKQILVPVPSAPVTRDMRELRRDLQQEAREQSGQNEINRGTPLPSKRTATEVHSLMQGQQSSDAARKMQIAEFVASSGAIYGALIQQYYSGERTNVTVMNPNGGSLIVPFDRNKIQRRFRYIMREGSTTPQSKEIHRQQQMAFITQFMQALQFLLGTFTSLGQSIRAEGLLEMWRSLAAQYDIPGLAEIFAPAPNQQMIIPTQPNIQNGNGAPQNVMQAVNGGAQANPQLIQSMGQQAAQMGGQG